jgi:hypothetical protein
VPSNVPDYGNGRGLYESKVRPSRVDPAKFGANYAAGLLFDSEDPHRPGGYDVTDRDRRVVAAGRARLVLGHVEVTSRATLRSQDLTFGFVHLGDHNLSGGVRSYRGPAAYQAMLEQVSGAFETGDIPETLRQIDGHFVERAYALGSLFRDEQRRVLDRVLRATLDDAEDIYHRLYDRHASLIRFLGSLDAPTPAPLRAAAELVLNASLRRELAAADLDSRRMTALVEEARTAGLALDSAGLAFVARENLERAMGAFAARPDEPRAASRVAATAEIIVGLPFPVDLFRAQNLFWRLREGSLRLGDTLQVAL